MADNKWIKDRVKEINETSKLFTDSSINVQDKVAIANKLCSLIDFSPDVFPEGEYKTFVSHINYRFTGNDSRCDII